MEEILINIDSRFRDINVYPSESKFKINLEKAYKNIISARLISLEINNSMSYIDSTKNNNWIKVHLPNKTNDPEGVKLQLEDGLLQVVSAIQNIFNELFQNTFNTNSALSTTEIDGKPFAEKYFYIFYLNEKIDINFNFNTPTILPSSIREPLSITAGWHSVYGIIKQIESYLETKFSERETYKKKNPLTPSIDLDNGNFSLNSFTLKIFDRRFRSVDITSSPINPTIHDCIRYDNFVPDNNYTTNNLKTNIGLLKEEFYKFYIYDTTYFITLTNPTTVPEASMGILDLLTTNNYIIPLGYNYTDEGQNLESSSKYYFNSIAEPPSDASSQIYNLNMIVNLTLLKVYFVNSYTESTCGYYIDLFYYWVDPLKSIPPKPGSWIQEVILEEDNTEITNKLAKLLDKTYLREQYFITQSQYEDPKYIASVSKDVAPFDIDFSTYPYKNPISNGILDIKSVNYPSLGFYLGYREDYSKATDKFLYSSSYDDADAVLYAQKIFNTAGENYIFFKVNDWGYIDFFNQKIFAKILLTTGLGNPKLDDYVNKEYRFRQPQNIQKLDIELIDFLGNPVDLNGFNFSFTIELKQLLNSDQKNIFERQNMIFTT
jgi:hypothetical protein